MTLVATVQNTSRREDSSGSCCSLNCGWLGSTNTELSKEEKTGELSLRVFSSCYKFREELKVSFGRPKKAFDCIKIGGSSHVQA